MKTCRAAKYWQLKKRENQVVKNSTDSLYVIDMCRNRFERPPSLISSEIFQAKWLIYKKLIGDIPNTDFLKLISRSILIVNKCILLNCLVKISRRYDQLYMYYNEGDIIEYGMNKGTAVVSTGFLRKGVVIQFN